MSDQSKKSFVLSVKRLRYFFNHIKDYDGSNNQLLESRANV